MEDEFDLMEILDVFGANESNQFPDHEKRMNVHMKRVWRHKCEFDKPGTCPDCIYLYKDSDRKIKASVENDLAVAESPLFG